MTFPRRAPGILRPVLLLSFGLLLAAPAGGCLLQNASPVTRLKDDVQALNSDLRWGRLDLAIQMVAPSYRRAFVRARTTWGDQVQIADSDVLGVRVVEEEDAAISTVTVRWYSYATMAVRETRVQQRWELQGRRYVLADEAVTGGDGRLLPGVPRVEEEIPGAEPEGPVEGSSG